MKTIRKKITSDYFVIVSAFNEGKRLGAFLKKLKTITKRIIVVDDGSLDNTKEIAEKYKTISVRHKINLGKGAAMKTGAEVAIALGAKKIIFIDGDGQHDPKAIPEIIDKMEEGYDIIFGARKIPFKMPFLRHLGRKMGVLIMKLSFGIYHSDPFCGLMAMTIKTYKKIEWNSSRYGVETEIVARSGKNRLKYAEVPIRTIYLDSDKGMTIIDAFEIILSIPKLKFT